MSDYRDKRGRYRARTRIDDMDLYGACVAIGLLITSPFWAVQLFWWASTQLAEYMQGGI